MKIKGVESFLSKYYGLNQNKGTTHYFHFEQLKLHKERIFKGTAVTICKTSRSNNINPKTE